MGYCRKHGEYTGRGCRYCYEDAKIQEERYRFEVTNEAIQTQTDIQTKVFHDISKELKSISSKLTNISISSQLSKMNTFFQNGVSDFQRYWKDKKAIIIKLSFILEDLSDWIYDFISKYDYSFEKISKHKIKTKLDVEPTVYDLWDSITKHYMSNELKKIEVMAEEMRSSNRLYSSMPFMGMYPFYSCFVPLAEMGNRIMNSEFDLLKDSEQDYVCMLSAPYTNESKYQTQDHFRTAFFNCKLCQHIQCIEIISIPQSDMDQFQEALTSLFTKYCTMKERLQAFFDDYSGRDSFVESIFCKNWNGLIKDLMNK